MKHLDNWELFLEKKWSGEVETKWHPKEGIFTKSAEEIAKYLKGESSGLKQAMSRLNFYINRSGKNLSKSRKETLEAAKNKLRELYGKKEKKEKAEA